MSAITGKEGFMMKAKLSALLFSLALLCAACGQKAGQPAAPPPEDRPPEVTAWELPTDTGEGIGQCLEVRNGKALFLDWEKENPDAPGGRNTVEVDLATGEKRELGFWSRYVQWDGGETYYWVGMTGPVERRSSGPSFGMGGPEAVVWREWVQEGIWRGNARGEGEILYLFPDNKNREITSLELQGKYLSWGERVRYEGGRPDGEEFRVLDLESGELRCWEGKGACWVDGGCLFSLDSRNILRAEGLADGKEIFDRWDEGITRAFFDGGRIIWNNGARSFHVYDCGTKQTRDLTDPAASEDEVVGSMELFRGRYLVYSVVEPVWGDAPEIGRGLRVFDLEKGEILYRSMDDPGIEKRENWYYGNLAADRDGGLALLAGTEHEPVEYWSLTGKGALSVFTLG